MADLRAGDIECLIVTGDNPECGAYVSCCAGFIDPGVSLLLGDVTSSDSDGRVVSWTRIGDGYPFDRTPSISTTELLETLRTDVEVEEQGKTDCALVLTGEAWDILWRGRSDLASSSSSPSRGDVLSLDDAQRLLSHVKVAARCSPGQKDDIVKLLAKSGSTVAMVGDGGNDCAALRAAHVGLALHGAEASMVSPFSSNQRSIRAVLDLVLEGRCALATSFALYKILILQGLTLASAGVR